MDLLSTDAATPVDHALDQLQVAVDHLLKVIDDGGLDHCDDPQLLSLLSAVEQARIRLGVVDQRAVTAGEARNLSHRLCQPSMAAVLAQRLLISRPEAARRCRAATALTGQVTMLGQPLAPARPYLADAVHAGQVNPEQADIILHALASVDLRGFDPADLDTGERLLVDAAATFGPKQLRQLAQHLVDHIDPDGSRPNDDLIADQRHLELRPGPHGGYRGQWRLTTALGAKLKALLDPLARPRISTAHPEHDRPVEQLDPRPYGQRLHDALEDLCDRLLRNDLADTGGTPATVIVTIDWDDLLTRTGHGALPDSTPITVPDLLQIAAEADIIPAVLNRAGAVLDLGRSRRIASRTQTLALTARDAGCSFPGCDHPPPYCERHHIVEWINGGLTDLDNLTLLCRYHHHHFLNRGWTIHLTPDRLPAWTPPRWIDPHQRPIIHPRIRQRQHLKC